MPGTEEERMIQRTSNGSTGEGRANQEQLQPIVRQASPFGRPTQHKHFPSQPYSPPSPLPLQESGELANGRAVNFKIPCEDAKLKQPCRHSVHRTDA